MKCGSLVSTTDPKMNECVCGECGEKRKGQECINIIEMLQSKLELMEDEDEDEDNKTYGTKYN